MSPELGLEREKQCLVMREGHSMRFLGMALDLCDELFLVRRAGFEPAVAMQNLVHDSRGEARNAPLEPGKIPARQWLVRRS